MRPFFSSFFASLLASFVFVLLLIFIFIGIAASSGQEKPIEVEAGSFLELDLNGVPVVDRKSDDPFSALAEAFGESGVMGLNVILKNIDKASQDPNIEGIILHSGIFLGGASTAKEIRKALHSFQQKGKKVYAYNSFFSSRGYYLASVADSLFVNESGMVDWTGISIGVTYYKGMLDKIGVKAQAIRGSNNKFKSAVEPFIQEEMSSSNRKQLETLLNDIWSDMLNEIAASRNLEVDDLQRFADSLAIWEADDVVRYRLCDGSLHHDEWDSFKENLLENKAEDKLIGMKAYRKVKSANSKGFQRDKVAVLYAQGEFTTGDDATTVNPEMMLTSLKEVREDDHVKALIIRVNSPGGQAWIADQMVREIELIRENIPVVISMGDVAASAGYMISAVGDTIFAQENTITGSIGVFGLLFEAQELLEEKIGLKTFHINTAAHSDLGTADRPLDDYERETLQKMIDAYYSHFIELVAENRSLDKNYIDSIGQGRVWSGLRAIELKLADAIGGMGEAEEAARMMAGLDSGAYRIVEFPEEKDPIEELLKSLENSSVKLPAALEEGPLAEGYEFYSKWHALQGVPLMQLEYDIRID